MDLNDGKGAEPGNAEGRKRMAKRLKWIATENLLFTYALKL